jgi:hypothetical protein
MIDPKELSEVLGAGSYRLNPELIPSFKMPTIDPPAKWMYERITRQIVEFEQRLSPDEEIGGRFVSAPKEGCFHIEDIAYWGPDMLIFHGRDFDGRPIQLLQHYTQLSLLLCSVPKEKEQPRRIGFVLESKLGGAASKK